MNRAQEAIARVLGVDDAIAERDETIGGIQEEYQTQLQDLGRQLEAVVSNNRLLARAFEDLDYLNLYDTHRITDILPEATRKETILKLRRLRHDNPLAKQGIRLIVRFTLGKGIQWITKNQPIRDALMEFWQDEDNKLVFTTDTSMKEFLDEVATDGEKFLACFEKANVAPYVKFAEVPLEEIEQIIYDPNNRRVPIWYKRHFTEEVYDGTKEHYVVRGKAKTLYYLDYRVTDEKLEEIGTQIKIPEAKKAKTPEGDLIKMRHSYVNPLWGKSGRRGISELYSSREWFRVFKEFMQDRAIINAAATAIAYKRKFKGGPTAVAQMHGKFGGIDVGMEENTLPASLTRPVAGATYDSNEAADIEWNKTDTGAANAKEDARMLLMVGGSGMGTNIHYFGEGGDANLATAQAMELPMVKNYEDWQKWLESEFMEIFDYVLRMAFGENIPFQDDSTEAEDGTDSNASRLRLITSNDLRPSRIEINEPEKKTVADVVSWDFPPIITKDVVKYMTAWAQLTQQVAPGNPIVHLEAIKGAMTVLGIPNVDQLIDGIKAEEERLQAEKEAQRQAMMDNLGNNGQGPDSGGDNGDGGKVPGFVKANAGGDPNIKRVASGKPPIQRNGRVAAGDRPGGR
jgi:hypothetical protein